MKKTSSLIDSHFMMSLLIVLFILFTPFFTYAGSVYRCVDKDGDIIISDHPSKEGTCKPQGSFKEMTDQELINYEKEKKDIEKRRDYEHEKKKSSKEALDECFQRADAIFKENWNVDCKLLHLNPDCSLPNENVKRWVYQRQHERNHCLKAYPQKP